MLGSGPGCLAGGTPRAGRALALKRRRRERRRLSAAAPHGIPPMLAQTRLPSLLLQLPRLRSVAPGLATMSSATGTLTVQQPLNYRAGARVQPADGGQLEEVFEPATGTDRGKLRGLGELCARRGGVLGFAQLTRVSHMRCPAAPQPPLLQWLSSASIVWPSPFFVQKSAPSLSLPDFGKPPRFKYLRSYLTVVTGV